MVVGQQSKQNRAPSPLMAKQSYTRDAILRLSNAEKCLIDMQRSRDDVMTDIGHTLEKEKSKLVLQREKSSISLRLSRYNAEIAEKKKALEEDYRRITSLRENIRSRRTALEEAKMRYQTGNECLEESQKILERARESLSLTTSKLRNRQRELVADLLTIYPIDPIDARSFSFKILGVPLPNSVFTGYDDEKVATALGFTCHLTNMLSYYLGVPLRFPMTPMSSRSTICDPISATLGDSRQDYNTEYVTSRIPFKRLLNWIILSIVHMEGLFTNNQLGALFPLHAKGGDRYRFEYAVFLLNKNIEQLMNSQGLNVLDLRNTLPNLKYLILSLSSGHTSHLRKTIPHNCTIPYSINNAIASTSNLDNLSEEEEEDDENSHSFSKSPNTSGSIRPIESSKRSIKVINTLQKNTIESHRLGVT